MQALPHTKWHKRTRDLSNVKSRNLYADGGPFKSKTLPGQKMNKQTPKGFKPTTIQSGRVSESSIW